jgi:hypothetical protein
MVRTLRWFLEFCYLVRRSVVTEDDLRAIDHAIACFHEEREIFRHEGVRPEGFSLPRQHAMTHYHELIQEFGAPNGLCSSITESKHIKAVKEPWRRSSRHEALGQMVIINQRNDRLVAMRVELQARGMLRGSVFSDTLTREELDDLPEDEDEGAAGTRCIIAEVKLARTPSKHSSFSNQSFI